MFSRGPAASPVHCSLLYQPQGLQGVQLPLSHASSLCSGHPQPIGQGFPCSQLLWDRASPLGSRGSSASLLRSQLQKGLTVPRACYEAAGPAPADPSLMNNPRGMAQKPGRAMPQPRLLCEGLPVASSSAERRNPVLSGRVYTRR